MFEKAGVKILIRILLLFIVLLVAAFIVVKGWYIFLLLIIPLLTFQLSDIYHRQKKTQDELDQFVESVHYRDFSRHFDVKHAPSDLQPLRKGFNQINTTFKTISKEKEASNQYLQKILEMVDTGILSYEAETGEVIWMNDSLKKMLQIPYLKTIHSLQRRNEALYNEILSLNPGDDKIITLHGDIRTFKILVSETTFQTGEQKFKLVAFQNINEALDETESKAWRKLLSVMTHEIMNSVAPISSLAETLKNRLEESHSALDRSDGVIHDLELGIDTIRNRSEGLMKFAETYRNLNKINKPSLQRIYVRDLFENLYQLMEPTLRNKNIQMDIVLSDTRIMVEADPSLLEQVMINLIINAKEALKEKQDGLIELSAGSTPKGKTIIKVKDNGPGMSDEMLENIFIPFFTTKKAGSGIGLSLCKQIMMLHKGSIDVQSVVGKGTVFALQFP